MHEIGAVIFDLDGLLVDSEPVQFAAWDEFAKRYGRTLNASLTARMYGTRLIEASELVSRELGLSLTAGEVAEERDQLFFKMITGNIAPKPGALQLLGTLSARGFPIALATSGHRRYVDEACKSAGIPRQFDVEVTGEMVVRGKPDPETFVMAGELLGVAPNRCLVLEDSPQGVAAARGAGMFCFAVPDNHAGNSDLSAAHLVIESLFDVLPAARAYGLLLSASSQG